MRGGASSLCKFFETVIITRILFYRYRGFFLIKTNCVISGRPLDRYFEADFTEAMRIYLRSYDIGAAVREKLLDYRLDYRSICAPSNLYIRGRVHVHVWKTRTLEIFFNRVARRLHREPVVSRTYTRACHREVWSTTR